MAGKFERRAGRGVPFDTLAATLTSQLLRPAEVLRKYPVSDWTLRHWSHQGRVRVVKTPTGQRRYFEHEVARLVYGPDSAEVRRRP